MTKKRMSDMVFKNIHPPDYKKRLTIRDFSEVIVRRLGVKRKESKANHAKLLEEMLKMKRENIPISIGQVAEYLGVSESQAYEEIRKWRTLGIIEFVKIPVGTDFVKGYMLSATTVNRLIDKVESSFGAFIRRTRRISKDFDDVLQLELARAGQDRQNIMTDSGEQSAEEPATTEEPKPEENKAPTELETENN
ncbi:MAG: hypothetical protein B6U68_03515 [Candidatus Aenigmarchaeota archaeon ex4484_14]|nr:MAG: hypothetical protein B6U68_03515 [Candidatus Aenigmarchaeota archaeon ex4484_14]